MGKKSGREEVNEEGKERRGREAVQKVSESYRKKTSFPQLHGDMVLTNLFSEKVESSSTDVSETIGSMKLLLKQLEQEKAGPTMEDFSQLKDFTTNLDAQFARFKSQMVEFMEDNIELLLAAHEAKSIPILTKRVERLEEDAERKRNWRINGWLLALTIISTAAAIWALFIR